LVIDTGTYNVLKFHPIFRDRIRYTSAGSVNLDMLAAWFDLPRGVMVAQRVFLDQESGDLVDFFTPGTAVLFYAPEGQMTKDANGATFMPLETSDRGVPSAFYTYQLSGYPVVESERYDPDAKIFLNDVIAEQSVIPVGLGQTGKVGAAFLANSVIA
jgi:hypothetical protein